MVIRPLLFSLCFAAATTFAAPTFAQSADLKALDDQAAQLEQEGNWQGALEVYRKIRTETGGRPPWSTAANHSNAAYQVGVHAEAATMLRYAIQQLPPTEPDYDALKEKFQGRMRELLSKVGRLRLDVQPKGAEVLIDGTSVGLAPFSEEVFLMPGSREVQVGLAGFEPQTRTLSIARGSGSVVQLALETPSEPVPSPVPLPTRSTTEDEGGISSTQLGLGITGVGLGVLGAAAAIILGLTSIDRGDAADDIRLEIANDPTAPDRNPCTPGPIVVARCSDLESVAQEEATFRGAAIGTGVVGGLLVIAGVTTLLVEDDDTPTVGFAAGPSGAMMQIRGGF